MLMANSAAILTDAFPPDRRGFALGINQAAAISGTFIGLLLGGLLAPINWRLIFLVSVPIGLFATVWGYYSLEEVASGFSIGLGLFEDQDAGEAHRAHLATTTERCR
jgi:MFS family permease